MNILHRAIRPLGLMALLFLLPLAMAAQVQLALLPAGTSQLLAPNTQGQLSVRRGERYFAVLTGVDANQFYSVQRLALFADRQPLQGPDNTFPAQPSGVNDRMILPFSFTIPTDWQPGKVLEISWQALLAGKTEKGMTPQGGTEPRRLTLTVIE